MKLSAKQAVANRGCFAVFWVEFFGNVGSFAKFTASRDQCEPAHIHIYIYRNNIDRDLLIYKYKSVYTHTFIHTYIHTYVHACICVSRLLWDCGIAETVP